MDGPGPGATERIRLRAWRQEDAPRLLDIRSRWEVVRWLDDPPEVMTSLVEAEVRIAEWHNRYLQSGGRRGAWAIEERLTGSVAGSVSLAKLPGGSDDDVEIGWVVHPDAQGRGVATEAAGLLLDYAFARGLPTVHAVTWADNVASHRVCLAIGLRDLGVVHDLWYPGESRQFRLDRADYLAGRITAGHDGRFVQDDVEAAP